jgi:hypothetical protein
VFPGHDAKNNVCVGDFFGINDLTSFTFDAICSISTCFGCGFLIDFARTRQDNVVLMIQNWISICAVVVLAEMYFFQDISVVEIIGFWCCSCDCGQGADP